VSIATELLRDEGADILPSAMVEPVEPTRMRRAALAAMWLVLTCAPLACTGPGLEPPASGNAGDWDAGVMPPEAGSGGNAGAAGDGGSRDAGVDGTDSDDDGGEVEMDASVDDDDSGIDPADVEP